MFVPAKMRQGFALVEALVGLAIIALLASFAYCVMAMANRLVRIEDGQIVTQDVNEDERSAMVIERRRASDHTLEGSDQSGADGPDAAGCR